VHHAEQGMAGFYRDVTANIMGACVLNATKMVCYDVSKGYVCNEAGWARKDVRTSFRSATLAGFFMTCTVSLFDRIRTGLMSHPTNAKLCDSFMECDSKIIKETLGLALDILFHRRRRLDERQRMVVQCLYL
jgi:hypothetical protein